MAFTDMNNVEQDLGEEKPPERNGSRNFMIIAGILGGIMVLALLCIAGLALFRYLPSQRAGQSANATNEAQATAIAAAASRTSSAPIGPLATRTLPPTLPAPTNTRAPTNTPVIAIGPSSTPAFNAPMATIFAMRTQKAQGSSTPAGALTQPPSGQPTSNQPGDTQSAPGQPTSTQAAATQPASGQPTARLTTTALPPTGIGEDLGTSGLLVAAVVFVVIIFLMRRLRTAS